MAGSQRVDQYGLGLTQSGIPYFIAAVLRISLTEKLCTVTFYLSWRHISVVKATKLDLAAFTAWSQVSNSAQTAI